MAWFSRRPKPLVPRDVLAQLHAFGSASWEARRSGRALTDARFSSFVSKVFAAFQVSPARTIAELRDAAGSDPLARYGAYQVIAEVQPEGKDAVFLELMDAALQMMFEGRLSSGHMTGFEADRWISTHGDLRISFDRTVEVAPPAPGTTTMSLDPGQPLLVARTGPEALDNQFWVERIGTRYRVFSMRAKNSDATTLTRYEEEAVGEFDSAEDVLRSLGRYLGRPCYWAHAELDPFFPERRG